ncbi:hypothetical protein EIN_155430 [Entamoeba invadens IP1]|uniref:Uncharacterized protein n=1 Tax=Entamoeba invadens IP1 TaxID=370355 RepID=A0A0A1UF59_ENTIV|nr:hypothetical protein EIN_155430 [Entamoeba invadens IP1]ELP91436.1 hypothetical protein EIN_155430 [Entamoeba invadens IP1]|eukprot:XP_004258207.1 hypothetical protein EIN_155430 [Entamoeba invadens IP1]
MEGIMKKKINDLGITNELEDIKITEDTVHILKDIYDYVIQSDTEASVFRFFLLNNTFNKAFIPLLKTLTSKSLINTSKESVKLILKMMLRYLEACGVLTASSQTIYSSGKPILNYDLFPLFSIILSSEIGKVGTENPTRNSELSLQICELIITKTTPKIADVLIPSNIFEICGIVFGGMENLSENLVTSAISLVISSCYLCFDSFETFQMQSRTEEKASKLQNLLAAETKREKMRDSRRSKRSVVFSVGGTGTNKVPNVSVSVFRLSIGEKVYFAKTLRPGRCDGCDKVAEVISKIVTSNYQTLVTYIKRTTDTEMRQKCFVVVGLLLKAVDFDFSEIVAVDFLMNLIDTGLFWYTKTEKKIVDYLTTRIVVWTINQVLDKIGKIEETSALQLETSSIDPNEFFEDFIKCGLLDFYVKIVQNFIPDRMPNDLLLQVLIGMYKCGVLCEKMKLMNENGQRVYDEFLKTFCTERSCTVVIYIVGCLYVDKFGEGSAVKTVLDILTRMEGESAAGFLYRVPLLLELVKIVREKNVMDQNEHAQAFYMFSERMIKKFNDDIVIDKTLLINSIFPSYRDLMNVAHLPRPKRTRKGKTEDEPSQKVSEEYNESTQREGEIQTDMENIVKTKGEEKVTKKKRKLVEIVEEEPENLEDIFNDDFDLDVPTFQREEKEHRKEEEDKEGEDNEFVEKRPVE